LPEEGGPAGGVIGGRLFVDMDDSGNLSSADAGIRGTVLVERISADGFVESIHDAQSDDEGHWEVRGLPVGRTEFVGIPR
jgi:hypothetical protein